MMMMMMEPTQLFSSLSSTPFPFPFFISSSSSSSSSTTTRLLPPFLQKPKLSLKLKKSPFFGNNSLLLPSHPNLSPITASAVKRRKELPFDNVIQKDKKLKFVLKVRKILETQPDRVMSLQQLGKHKRELGLDKNRKLIAILRKFPAVFQILEQGAYSLKFKLTPEAEALYFEELRIRNQMEDVLVTKLRKLLMMSLEKRILLEKIAHLAADLGLPREFRETICHRYPQYFKVVATQIGPALQLTHWDPDLALSAAQLSAEDNRIRDMEDQNLIIDRPPKFNRVKLPKGLKLSKGETREILRFRDIPYISPYSDFSMIPSGSPEKEKHACGVVHEILSLTLEKRTLVDHFTHFRDEFRFTQQLRGMLIRHPDMFYVSLKGDRDSVFLREAYRDSKLVDKDRLLLIKEKLRSLVSVPRFPKGRGAARTRVGDGMEENHIDKSGEEEEEWSESEDDDFIGDDDDDWSDDEFDDDDTPPDFDEAAETLEIEKGKAIKQVQDASQNNEKVLIPVFQDGRPRERNSNYIHLKKKNTTTTTRLAMAYSTPTTTSPAATMDHNHVVRRRTKDLCTNLFIPRSSYYYYYYSHNNYLCCSPKKNRIQSSVIIKSVGSTSPIFQLSASIPKWDNILNTIDHENIVEEISSKEEEEEERVVVNRANWVGRLMEIKKHWRNRLPRDMDMNGTSSTEYDCDDVCEVEYGDEEEDDDPEYYSFSKFLVPVSWSDTKLYSQLAFLCNMAYVIPQIKATDLRRYYSLQFITSSLEKKAAVAKLKEKLNQEDSTSTVSVEEKDYEHKYQIRHAYEIAASAASYVQLRAKNLLSLAAKQQQSEEKEDEGSSRVYYNKSEVVAAYMAASTMISVVAAGEKEKQEAANELQSLQSSPCEWFVCDDFSNYTRCFVVQGSDSLASWQANLFFEPTKFENTDVVVHRGIYEAAKGIYEQLMPEIVEHLKRHGDRARLQFTGHSLGGSLSLLVHLMLLSRKVVSRPSTLRPVVTFGSPFVFCGGQRLIEELGLGLDERHVVHCVMMHRDIVPRAFSCNYPDHVALLLKRLNTAFRSHPCLMKNKVLYSAMGKILVLQPDEKTSPPHPLLPLGSGFYALDSTKRGYSPTVLRRFLNEPHPIETLSDPTAYGSEGTILRDHDSSNYLKAVNGILRQHSKKMTTTTTTLVGRVAVREQQRINELWPLLTSPSPHSWSHERCSSSSSLIYDTQQPTASFLTEHI